MADEPQVSLIVPIYNVEAFLDRCLKSIQEQSFVDFEAICLNDGSTDGSLALVKKYVSTDDRFILIDKENEGYGSTCNRGINAARGRYVGIIEPDDYILPTMLEEMLDFADSFDVPIDIVKTPWLDVRNWNSLETEQIVPGYLYGRLPTSTKPFTLPEATILIETHPAIWSALYLREFLNREHIRFRPYPGAGWADNPFLIETMVKANTIAYLDKAFYCYQNELPCVDTTPKKPDPLPVVRWIEMANILDDLQVKDSNTWKSHYIRGINYLEILLDSCDQEQVFANEHVQAMLSRMDTDLILGIDKVSPARKRMVLDAKGKDATKISAAAYRKHAQKELFHLLRTRGLGGTVAHLRDR